jgi:hypothetical protein
MRRSLLLFSALVAFAALPRTAAADVPSAPAPSSPPSAEIGLGSLQLVVGYTAEAGVLGLIAAGVYPKQLGIHSDYANLVYVAALAPSLAGVAVCGTGYLSRSYRGRCWTTMLGAYVGAAVGGLIGMMVAPAPGPDDTGEFMAAMSGIAGVFVFSPIGAAIGYHVGKREIVREGTRISPAPPDVGAAIAPPVTAPARTLFAQMPTRGFLMPLVNLSW